LAGLGDCRLFVVVTLSLLFVLLIFVIMLLL
jgi:hypothetical protein